VFPIRGITHCVMRNAEGLAPPAPNCPTVLAKGL